LLWAAAAPPPDILVSGDGRLAAVRLTGSRHAIAISSVTVGRFTATKWRQALGVKAEAITRFQSAGTLLECDDLGCVFQADQTRVGFSRSPAGQDEDCQNVDILISPHFPVWRPCAGPTLVLDSRDFLSHGAHAIWLNKDQFVVRTIASERGQRPWTGSNR
jgi:competence protein ComEC